jgi:hypothetical protein
MRHLLWVISGHVVILELRASLKKEMSTWLEGSNSMGMVKLDWYASTNGIVTFGGIIERQT